MAAGTPVPSLSASVDLSSLPTWEYLQKRMTWDQLGDIRGKRILDFGSGNGATASHFAALGNEVTAVEPDGEAVKNRFPGPYAQLTGSLEVLDALPPGGFDIIFCHNVLEYVEDQPGTVRALCLQLKPDGLFSLLKHHRPGRVMQMAVLLNDFDRANALLSGENGRAAAYGAIRYYEDGDLFCWAPELTLTKTLGQRTFWDLQQKQEIQTDPQWRADILALEHRVSTLPEYQAVAFFHHLLLTKSKS